MKVDKNIVIKLYYRSLNCIIPKEKEKIPSYLQLTKNVFFYFDYEREFSGHNTKIKDSDIKHLVDLLNDFSIKATWFTVGKIFQKYTETVNLILENGHELGSHTFSHHPPLSISKKELRDDFKIIEEISPVKILGFHSPNGRWTLNTIKYLERFGYKYDVVSIPRATSYIPFKHIVPIYGAILRLITVGDDWFLYRKSNSEADVFKHFKTLYLKVRTGNIAGIGFHPWVLFSDERILNGFKLFLKYVQEQQDLRIERAIDYANLFDEVDT